jgi:GxxExxY protein
MRIDERDSLSGTVIEAAIRVHKCLGPGLLESVYETCLAHELAKARVPFERGRRVPVVYDGVAMDQYFRLDLVVGGALIVELKSVHDLHAIHTAQVLTYLRLTGLARALSLNFNVPRLVDGIRRIRL